MKSLKEMISMEQAIIFVLFLLVSLHILKTDTAEIDIISNSKFLTEKDTLVSPGGTFELGFFNPDSSKSTYLGIWYKKISVKTVVWVANRDRPLMSVSSAILRIVNPGNLVLMNKTNDAVWSSNTTSSGNATAHLDEAGNFVMIDGTNTKVIWQSFDYPTDTLLAGMKFGKNHLRGVEWSLSSWKSSHDPAPGEFTWTADTRGYPQHILRQGTVLKYRGGPWNGLRFSGASQLSKNTIFTYNMVINDTEEAYSYNLVNSSVITRFTLNSSGHVERSVWVEDGKRWQLTLTLPKDSCDAYNICGAYGTCSLVSSKTCSCLDETKFMPRSQKNWDTADWSGGCLRRTPLDCKNGSDGFIKYHMTIKLPDTQTSLFNMTMSLKECEAICQQNCTCMAYANTDIRGKGSGCLLWFNDLLDTRVYPEGNDAQDIYVRMAFSELVFRKNGRTNIKIILIGVFLGVLMIGLITWLPYAWRKHHLQPFENGGSFHLSESRKEDIQLPSFSFSTIAAATAKFSTDNILGVGGFGTVYKGVLEDGLEIAVKRLSKTSNQGVDEFKNEVICISKLQHRNLVKLLGCCVEGHEKLLIYEYMPNKSLDSILFHKTHSMLLDWTKRFNIIKGVARGLVYLHHDSRLRIIHRDLKASNILLDLDMNPKISDFGIARSFGGNETEANTNTVVGTYGYMSPEYALDGIFSIKSDAFSFGVLVLEIVSGNKNRGFIHPEHDNNLIGHAWSLYNEGKSMELIDASLAKSCNPPEVLRSVQVGLLCVQQNAADRPNMTSVVQMLGGEGVLPQPKEPSLFMNKEFLVADFTSSNYQAGSVSDLTITDVDAR